jgi:hypothetical protein
VSGAFSEEFRVTRPDVTDEMRRSHNDEEKATEHGAEGVAFLLVRKLTPYKVILQTRKGKHFDWWLGYRAKLLQEAARLEVSGIRSGSAAQLQARTDEKLVRARRAKMTLPLYVCVTNFKLPCAMMVQQ